MILFYVFLGEVVAQDKKEVTLEDIWEEHKFSANSIGELRSMDDGAHYTVLESRKEGVCIVKYAYANDKYEKILVNAKELKWHKKSVKIDDYEFSADETKLLIASGKEQIYRHSSKSHYYIYDLVLKS